MAQFGSSTILSRRQLDETRQFYYSDQWQVLEERIDTVTTAEKQYLWGIR